MGLQVFVGLPNAEYNRQLEQRIKDLTLTRRFVVAPADRILKIQQRLVDKTGLGYMDIEVLTFNQLAFRLTDIIRPGSQPIISDQDLSMLMRRAVTQVKEQLTVYQASCLTSGFIQQLQATYRQLRQENCSLNRLISTWKNPSGAAKAKLADLQLIFSALQQLMDGQYELNDQALLQLPKWLNEADDLSDLAVAFEETSILSGCQYEVINALLKRQVEVLVSFIADQQVLQGDKPDSAILYNSTMLFQQLKQAAVQQKNTLEVIQCPQLEPIANGLKTLAEHLFTKPAETIDSSVSLVYLADIQAEVNYAVSLIKQLVSENNYRYRQIALVIPADHSYQVILQSRAKAEEVPLYQAEDFTLLDSPVAAYVNGLLDMAITDMSSDNVIAFLRSGLTVFEPDQIDQLENYLLACDPSGRSNWEKPWAERWENDADEMSSQLNNEVSIEPLHQRFLQYYDQTIADLQAAKGFEEIVQILFETIKVEAGRRTLWHDFDAEVSALLQIFTSQLFDGKENCDILTYRQLLQPQLSNNVTSLHGLKSDCVTALSGLKMPMECKVLIVLGVNDGLFPAPVKPATLFTMAEYEQLQKAGLNFSTSPLIQLWGQRQQLYQLLTCPTDRLYVSYSLTDGDGRTLAPSYMMEQLSLASGVKIKAGKVEPLLIAKGQHYLATGLAATDYSANDPLWAQLGRWYQHHCPNQLQNMLNGTSRHNTTDDLKPETVFKLFGPEMVGSVTRLERYSACPFAFFVQYGLRLQPRSLAGIQNTDFGLVMHQLFEEYGKAVTKKQLDWPDLTEQQQDELTDQVVEQLRGLPQYQVFFNNPANSPLRFLTLARQMVHVLTCQLAAGSFKPQAYEFKFDEMGVEPIKMENGLTLRLKGSIDRLDLYDDQAGHIMVKIVDYKTGSTEFDELTFINGLNIQLMEYMSEAMEYLKKAHPDCQIIPAAALYFHVRQPEVGMEDEQLLKKLRPSGLVNIDSAVLSALDKQPTGPSLVAPFKRKVDGSPSASQKGVIPAAKFDEYLASVKKIILANAKAIGQGRYLVFPYRISKDNTACQYCLFRSICGFDYRIYGYEYHDLSKSNTEETSHEMDN